MKASVVIPAYNAETYIERAIESARQQTLSDLEILVVDDGSTDDTASIVEGIAAKDDRVKLIRFPTNKGVSAARNAAFDRASGDWVAILDADDWYAPERLARLIETAEAEGVDLVADNHNIFREGKDPSYSYTLLPMAGAPVFSVTAVDFLRNVRPGHSGMLNGLKPVIRRSTIEEHHLKYRQYLTTAEDFNLLLQCLAVVGQILVLRSPTYFKLNRKDSLRTVWQEDDLQARLRSFDELLEVFAGDEVVRDLLCKRRRQTANLWRILRILQPARRLQFAKALKAAAYDLPIVPRFLWYGTSGLLYRLKTKLRSRPHVRS